MDSSNLQRIWRKLAAHQLTALGASQETATSATPVTRIHSEGSNLRVVQWQNLSKRTFGCNNSKIRRSATGSHGANVGWWLRTTNHPRIICAGSGSVPRYRNRAIIFSGRTCWIWRPCRLLRGPAKTTTTPVEVEVEERRKRMRRASSVSSKDTMRANAPIVLRLLRRNGAHQRNQEARHLRNEGVRGPRVLSKLSRYPRSPSPSNFFSFACVHPFLRLYFYTIVFYTFYFSKQRLDLRSIKELFAHHSTTCEQSGRHSN